MNSEPWSTRIDCGYPCSTHPFERGHDVLAAIAEAGIDGRREARPGVNNGENTQLPACRQLIVHELHRPGLVASRRLGSVVPVLRPLRSGRGGHGCLPTLHFAAA